MFYLKTSILILLGIVSRVELCKGQKVDFWGDAMFNAVKAEHRELAAEHFFDSISFQLENYNDTALLSGKDWLIYSHSPDSLLELLSTGYQRKQGAYYYKCYYRYQGDNWHSLSAESTDHPLRERGELSLDRWYGAWYNDIVQYEVDDKVYYLVFGKSKVNKAYDAKVCEVFWFDQLGDLHLGAPIFVKEREDIRDETKSRICIQYSDPGNINLRYDPELEIISYNHVVTIPSEAYEGKPLRVQDGSYELYRKGPQRWVYEEYLFDSTTRPRPEKDDKKDVEKRDIMGRRTGVKK